MHLTSICIGGNLKYNVYKWVPIFRPRYMNGVGFEILTEISPWLPQRGLHTMVSSANNLTVEFRPSGKSCI